jgi:histone H3/H4
LTNLFEEANKNAKRKKRKFVASDDLREANASYVKNKRKNILHEEESDQDE